MFTFFPPRVFLSRKEVLRIFSNQLQASEAAKDGVLWGSENTWRGKWLLAFPFRRDNERKYNQIPLFTTKSALGAREISQTYLHALDFELHVVLSGGLAVLSLLPAVPVPPVADLLPRVEEHRAALRSNWVGERVSRCWIFGRVQFPDLSFDFFFRGSQKEKSIIICPVSCRPFYHLSIKKLSFNRPVKEELREWRRKKVDVNSRESGVLAEIKRVH